MIEITKIQKKLFYLLGLFCTFSALKFGSKAAFFNYIILLIIIFQFVSKKRIYFYYYKIPIYLFISLMPISVALNFTNIDNKVMVDGIGITIKFIFFILPIIILFTDKELCMYRKNFFKGLYLASWIQLIWGTMQIILYHTRGLFLNQLIFGDILNIDLKTASWVKYTGIGIRPTGIGWETAVYAISLLFGFAYTNKFYFKLLFGISILLSTSSTGIITLFVLIVYDMTLNMYLARKDGIREVSSRENNFVLKMVLIIFVAILIIMITIYNKDVVLNLISYVDNSIQRIIRIISGQNSAEISTSIHALYYQKIIETLFNGNIIQSIFGYGNFMVGRLYSLLYGLYSDNITAWNPESDFITILLGTGVAGMILYYFLIYKAFILTKNLVLRKYLIIIFISGFSYLFIRGTFTFIIIIFLMVENGEILAKNDKNGNIKV